MVAPGSGWRERRLLQRGRIVHGHENVLISTIVGGYTTVYILVKILSTGAFWYKFIKFCLNKVYSKKQRTITLKQNTNTNKTI